MKFFQKLNSIQRNICADSSNCEHLVGVINHSVALCCNTPTECHNYYMNMYIKLSRADESTRRYYIDNIQTLLVLNKYFMSILSYLSFKYYHTRTIKFLFRNNNFFNFYHNGSRKQICRKFLIFITMAQGSKFVEKFCLQKR